MGFDHDILPKLIHLKELGSLLRQLLLDILGIEYILQIHPLSLAIQPLVNYIRNQHQLPFPFLHLRPDLSHEPCPQHGLHFQLMVVKSCNYIIQSSNYELVFLLSVITHCKCQFRPLLPDFLHLRFYTGLTTRSA